ncbi:MAG: ParB/RepB/Spo0J family partition protein [Paracoccus sp. (in: a-proteobacteria)]|jgi:ParB family transcriptional regulator, chromosome partitioning protein|uniref:ParB/RepB/Spo0J family partition protein n=1 Tax=Paracoccus sp. TaxID=267 RepID=UPI000C4CE0FF|nr:ParB N-terminal domain-containing protein [Paracoccus sp. (in: a-proteobacteria)]MAN55046.1 chromosome partitioning protein [Paracoccus sp. (in: a-proteobacteria)]MAN58048.1 chromosome partitioning protein [Paracoccus sp. (in: a-proteobacteria)]MBA47540.1 chromosome partitioning protein [Paracoccus sp. (in: a-proteobacteria)]MBA50450.1 chromosome partitioning protein [Paracoccus sp. (in: a-proteobacteria)]MCS5602686.1 ParB N-terminal domain-containing protein [Paracoccus sp. (in: a-proteoba|tara:strand:- start:651 stop:1658 length:1008 start_codon:yes stop_codon:yes gene_type:complete
MAKRRRLTPAAPSGGETGSEDQMGYPLGVAPTRDIHSPPVARIAGDAATRAALEDLAAEMRSAREGGRMVQDLPLDRIEAGHLTRDRMIFGAEDMAALKASIAARGQQTPIEVVALRDGRFGLISGARRLSALRALHEETGEDRFGQVRALLRPFDAAPDAYLAMVEENEIRADLSFYERARLAHEAARIGVFPDAGAAVKALFVHVSASKRSKILNFVALHQALGAALRFPEAIPEHLGLALAKRAAADPDFAPGLARRLASRAPTDAAGERAVLDRALAPAPKEAAQKATQDAGADQPEGVQMTARPGRIILSGQGVTPDLARDLQDWLAARG